jgi:hypothetical protein
VGLPFLSEKSAFRQAQCTFAYSHSAIDAESVKYNTPSHFVTAHSRGRCQQSQPFELVSSAEPVEAQRCMEKYIDLDKLSQLYFIWQLLISNY